MICQSGAPFGRNLGGRTCQSGVVCFAGEDARAGGGGYDLLRGRVFGGADLAKERPSLSYKAGALITVWGSLREDP